MNHSTHIEQNKRALKEALINNCRGSADNMTVSALCCLAGVSRASFYNYYDGIHSVIEDIEQQYLPLLLEDNACDNSLPVTIKHMDIMYKNKSVYLFLFRNGNANKQINNISRALFRERPNTGNCAVSEDTVSLFVHFLTTASVQLLIYALEHQQTISHHKMAQLHLIIEKHAYAMIEEYEALPKQ